MPRPSHSHGGSRRRAAGLRYSKLTIFIRVARHARYWGNNVVLPLFLVSTSLFATFALPPEETNDRLASTLVPKL